jgi:hypothetical protein
MPSNRTLDEGVKQITSREFPAVYFVNLEQFPVKLDPLAVDLEEV